ncbi:MAG: MBL fold hydrolase [Chloroflexi bacterium]|nr:MBL fold hydrolase [Chloroflexota bacterium]
MLITNIILGELYTNCYLVSNKSECIIIDPGAEPKKIIEFLHSKKLTPKLIISTHYHADHIGGVKKLVEKFDVDFALGKNDLDYLNNQPAWVSNLITSYEKPESPDILLSDEEKINIIGLEIKIIATPGHSPGSICIYIEDNLFTGDTLFRNGIGRGDLPGGDINQEILSIKKKIFTLPDNVNVFPGHGESTKIKNEKNNNIYLA